MADHTCRDEILDACKAFTTRSGQQGFEIPDIIEYLHDRGTSYADSTIRTHITSRMCVNAPDNHAVTYPDLERLGRGRYRLLQASA